MPSSTDKSPPAGTEAPEGYAKQCIAEWARARARVRRCAHDAHIAEKVWQCAIDYEQEAHRIMTKVAAGRFQEEIKNVE